MAIPKFLSEIIAVKEVAKNISSLVSEDLTKTGLFRIIPDEAHISKITNFKALLPYSDWKAINVQGLISGAVTITKLKNHDCEDHRGCLVVKYKLFDIFSENIISAKPISYLDSLAAITSSQFVITDSGGVQKEAYFSQKKSFLVHILFF